MMIIRRRMSTMMRERLVRSATSSQEEFADVLMSGEEYEAKKVEPPLFLGSKAGDLAQDLYVYAHVKGKLDEVASDMRKLSQSMRMQAFEQLLMDKTVTAADKRDLVIDYLARLGAWRGTQKFMGEVALEDDIHRIEKIAGFFEELYGQYKSTVPLHITTAAPADKKSIDKIVERIRAANLRPQDDVVVTTSVDPDLIDGYVYSVRGSKVDLSMKNQLEEAFNDINSRASSLTNPNPIPKFDILKSAIL